MNVIYARNAGTESIEDQVRDVSLFAESNNIKIDKIYADHNKSGLSVKNLPELQELLANTDNINTLVVRDLSRLSRDITVLHDILSTLHSHNVNLVVMKGGD